MKKAIIKAFPRTLPVMAGYIFLGIAFGILAVEYGFGMPVVFAMSAFVYAGSAQFLGVALMAANTPLPQVFFLVLVLNFRHFFYGLSMLSRYKGKGAIKQYLIFALSDETYALLAGSQAPGGVEDRDYYLAVTALDQIYWIAGSIIGAAIGGALPIDLTGIDFAMTALFAVLFVEQWKNTRCHIPAVTGFIVSVLALILLGANSYLIPALVGICFLVLVLREKIELSGS